MWNNFHLTKRMDSFKVTAMNRYIVTIQFDKGQLECPAYADSVAQAIKNKAASWAAGLCVPVENIRDRIIQVTDSLKKPCGHGKPRQSWGIKIPAGKLAETVIVTTANAHDRHKNIRPRWQRHFHAYQQTIRHPVHLQDRSL